jgi:G3E family GTPase
MHTGRADQPESDVRIPVTVLTGFLGSGKTTLLRRFLSTREIRNVGVLVNEVAEAGIDQRLLDPLEDGVQLLENGCICCAVREDLRKSLCALLDRRPSGAISHVVIETTGLADPAPILATFASDPMLTFHFRLGAVVTAVDCMNAPAQQLGHHSEFANQIAAADRVVLTKTDIADLDAIEGTRALVARLNPAATVVAGAISDTSLAQELFADAGQGLDEAARFCRLVAANLPATRLFGESPGGSDDASRHRAMPFCIAVDQSFDWSAFAVWLTMLLHAHGEKVLRVKGILNIAGSNTPVLINGTHRLMHQPEHLPAWPDDERRSVIVFIVAGMDPEAIRRSFDALVT